MTDDNQNPAMCPEQAWAIDDVLRERRNQQEKWGDQNHDMATWMLILHEETGELSEAILHERFGGPQRGNVFQEAVQVAAVAVQIIERLRIKTVEARTRLSLSAYPRSFSIPAVDQATNCASCGQLKSTPLRNDAMGGYVCLTCVDHELIRLQGGAVVAAGDDTKQFIEQNEIQLWPNREKGTQSGRIVSWTIQMPKPFKQFTEPTLAEVIGAVGSFLRHPPA